jgi:hypothetical protein
MIYSIFPYFSFILQQMTLIESDESDDEFDNVLYSLIDGEKED